MDRTSAVELEGMLMAARHPLQAVADRVRETSRENVDAGS